MSKLEKAEAAILHLRDAGQKVLEENSREKHESTCHCGLCLLAHAMACTCGYDPEVRKKYGGGE